MRNSNISLKNCVQFEFDLDESCENSNKTYFILDYGKHRNKVISDQSNQIHDLIKRKRNKKIGRNRWTEIAFDGDMNEQIIGLIIESSTNMIEICLHVLMRISWEESENLSQISLNTSGSNEHFNTNKVLTCLVESNVNQLIQLNLNNLNLMGDKFRDWRQSDYQYD